MLHDARKPSIFLKFTNKKMRQVQLEHIEKAIDIVDNLNDDALEELTDRLIDLQPELVGYLMTAVEDYKNENLSGYIAYYYSLVMESFSQANLKLGLIKSKDIEDQEDEFTAMLDNYFSSEDLEIVEDFTEQSALVQFILIDISTDDVDGSSMDEETATQIFIVFVAMTALLNKAII